MADGLKARLLGIALLAGGIALGWFFGLGPLNAAHAGAERVEYDVKLFVAAPMMVVSGIVLLLFGGAVLRAFTGPPQTKQDHLIVWPVFALALVAGGVGYWWFDAQLKALGYVTGG